MEYRQTDTSAIGDPGRSASDESARFTVIVPAYNPGKDLERCLEALAQSTYEQFDVLVVDDGSTEPISPLVERFGYRYLRIDGPSGPARARNLGVQQAKSEFVIFIDADVCVHPDTIERFARSFTEDKDLAAVIGSYDDSPADPKLSLTVSEYVPSLYTLPIRRADYDLLVRLRGDAARRLHRIRWI
ncbi:MAG: glycosyltransferase family A protein [Planctomycetota bacterium]|jgi:glycosyltransferase involved in cell wall biosynthesis